jgi:hypothetical protein
MTGPEHYRTAEELLGDAVEAPAGSDEELYFIGAAQTHATLALAAATALPGHTPDAWAASASKRSGR